jgi:hypothetical protein
MLGDHDYGRIVLLGERLELATLRNGTALRMSTAAARKLSDLAGTAEVPRPVALRRNAGDCGSTPAGVDGAARLLFQRDEAQMRKRLHHGRLGDEGGAAQPGAESAAIVPAGPIEAAADYCLDQALASRLQAPDGRLGGRGAGNR